MREAGIAERRERERQREDEDRQRRLERLREEKKRVGVGAVLEMGVGLLVAWGVLCPRLQSNPHRRTPTGGGGIRRP